MNTYLVAKIDQKFEHLSIIKPNCVNLLRISNIMASIIHTPQQVELIYSPGNLPF